MGHLIGIPLEYSPLASSYLEELCGAVLRAAEELGLVEAELLVEGLHGVAGVQAQVHGGVELVQNVSERKRERRDGQWVSLVRILCTYVGLIDWLKGWSDKQNGKKTEGNEVT